MKTSRIKVLHFFVGFCLSASLVATLLIVASKSSPTYQLQEYHLIAISLKAICVAILEELAFRHYLYKILRNFFKQYHSVIIGSLIFALLHLGNSNVTSIAILSHFVGGLVYSVAYIRTNNLSLPIGLHFGWNVMQQLFSVPMSGLPQNRPVAITLSKNELMLGGAYGIEGGLYSIFLRIAMIAVIGLIFKKPAHD